MVPKKSTNKLPYRCRQATPVRFIPKIGMHMKENISKVLYNRLNSLNDNKALLWSDFQISFDTITGKSINNYLDDVHKVLDELEASKYIRCEQMPNKAYRFVKGIDFEEWVKVMNPKQNNNPINIREFKAKNVQIGNQNSMVVNVTPDEFVAALTKLIENKSKKSQQSIIEKLSNYVKTGVSFGKLVAKLVALIG